MRPKAHSSVHTSTTVSQNLRWSSPPYVPSSSSSSFTPASCSCRPDLTGTSEHDLAAVCHDDNVAGSGAATNAGVMATLEHIVVARTAPATRRMSRRPEHHPVFYYLLSLLAGLSVVGSEQNGGRTVPQNVFPRCPGTLHRPAFPEPPRPPPPVRSLFSVKPASLATRYCRAP